MHLPSFSCFYPILINGTIFLIQFNLKVRGRIFRNIGDRGHRGIRRNVIYVNSILKAKAHLLKLTSRKSNYRSNVFVFRFFHVFLEFIFKQEIKKTTCTGQTISYCTQKSLTAWRKQYLNLNGTRDDQIFVWSSLCYNNWCISFKIFIVA